MRFFARKNQFLVLQMLSCILYFACNKSPDFHQEPRQENAENHYSQDASALTLSTIMSLPVRLYSYGELQRTEGSFALTLNPAEISLSIVDCASGYEASSLVYDGLGIELYRSDRNCKIGIADFQYNGELFSLAPGYSFDYEQGAMTLFESSDGKQFFVKVETQIAPILTPTSEAVFTIVQIDAPQHLVLESQKPIIRVINPHLEITEGEVTSLTFTLEKVNPSRSDYIIDVNIGGTVDANDVSPISQQIVFPNGSSSYELEINILDDSLPEGNKDLILNFSMNGGVHFYGDYQVLLKDDDPMVPLGGQVIWLQPGDLASPIASWVDQGGGSPHPAIQDSTRRQPSFVPAAVNGVNAAYFDGINDIMTFSDHPELNTGGPYDDKVIFVVFRSSGNISDKQVIYEQGGKRRGLNIYLMDGQIYFNAWNRRNDDNGATSPWNPVYVAAPISANTNYVAVLRFSYTNKRVSAYLQGQLVGETLGLGRLFSHSGNVAIGGVHGSTFYHDGTSDRTYFNGHISEFIKYNGALEDGELQGLMNQLTDTYIPEVIQEVRLEVAQTSLKEEGSEQTILTVSRDTAYSEDLTLNLVLSGNAEEGFDFQSLESYTVTIPAFELSVDIPIKLIDDSDIEANEILTVTIEDPGISGVSILAGSLDISIIDNDSYTPENYVFWFKGDSGIVFGASDSVKIWEDLSTNNIDASQARKRKQPDNSGLLNGKPALYFDGKDKLNIANHELINTGESYSQKTIAFAFRTSDDINRDQVIYEQGGGTRGLNIHIRAGVVYFSIWNFANDDSGVSTPFQSVYLSSPISPETSYVGTFVYDYNDGGNLHLHLNDLMPQTIVGAGKLFKHRGRIAIGASNGTMFFDNKKPDGKASFKGFIAELLYFNDALGAAQLNSIQDYLLEKYLP